MKPMSNPRPEPAPLLAFGCHPDDVEFGCGGVVALETRAGRAGARGRLLARRVGQPRHAGGATGGVPGRRAALGASLELIELDGDAHLEEKAAHAIRLAGVIRRLRPATVLAPTPVENQHPDHYRLGRLVRDAARIARYGGVAELRGLAPHAIEQLFFYAMSPGAEPRDVSPILVDVSAPEVLAAWTAAMEAHATQVKARAYVEMQLTRARVNGLRAGVGHAIALYPNDPPVVDSLARLGRNASRF